MPETTESQHRSGAWRKGYAARRQGLPYEDWHDDHLDTAAGWNAAFREERAARFRDGSSDAAVALWALRIFAGLCVVAGIGYSVLVPLAASGYAALALLGVLPYTMGFFAAGLATFTISVVVRKKGWMETPSSNESPCTDTPRAQENQDNATSQPAAPAPATPPLGQALRTTLRGWTVTRTIPVASWADAEAWRSNHSGNYRVLSDGYLVRTNPEVLYIRVVAP